MSTLAFDTYGKTRVRLLQVLRENAGHEVTDLTINVLFEGDLVDSFVHGDNSRVLPTDTMKNTVYALARQHPIESIEVFGSIIGRHFLERLDHITTVKVSIDQTLWDPVGSHPAAFSQTSKEQRTADLSITRNGQTILCGLRNLQILKTDRSAFTGYLKDEYTTLPETADRLLGTVLDAHWTVTAGLQPREFNELHAAVRTAMLKCFADHESLSVQHTLYAMAEAALARLDRILDIHLKMPNKHCLLVDLAPFGLDNPNRIFLPTDEPSGWIEARLTR